MKYVDEFRDKKRIAGMADTIRKTVDPDRTYRFMEVCGTHTMSIAKFGLRDLFPPNIQLLSGPGCPVCVTPTSYIDRAVAYAGLSDTILATFGDMMKVPGSRSSLQEARSKRGDIEIIYSPLDALKIALDNPAKRVIFLGVGFETTAPTVAATIRESKKKRVGNFFVLSGHKIMPPALQALVMDRDLRLDGFILPAHVSTIIGSSPYTFISRRYGIANVIAGFEPLDIMQGVYMLVRQVRDSDPKVEIQYSRVATARGNRAAQDVLKDVFDVVGTEWRGLGVIGNSGLRIKRRYSKLDAEENIEVALPKPKDAAQKGCICGRVLKGASAPKDCKLFGRQCTPEHPVGPCMVSSEGTCSAWYLHS